MEHLVQMPWLPNKYTLNSYAVYASVEARKFKDPRK